jgi:hypothetical protein
MFLLLSILFAPLFSSGQEDTATLHFLNDVLKRKHDSATIYYTDQVDKGMFDYMMNQRLLKRRIKDLNATNKVRLKLTHLEIMQLNQSLATSRDYQWKEGLFEHSKRIPVDSVHLFLLANRNNDVYLFSRPAFMRNNTLVVFYVVHLCCGGIYGPVDFSFYHRVRGKWVKWFQIGGGAF